MFKRSLLLLIGLLLAATVAGAAPIQPPYPVTFWVIGSLEAPAGAGLTAADMLGFKVYMYKDSGAYLNNYSSAESQYGGRFALNGMADYGMQLVAGQTYYFGTEKKTIGPNSYGMSETAHLLTQSELDQGYISLGAGTFLITQGGGLVGPITADKYTDNGLIRETMITRLSDKSLKITWNYAPTLPVKMVSIYRLSGPAKEYAWANLSEWGTPIFTSATDGVVEFTDDPSQVQAYDGKYAYYRVVPSTVPQTDLFGSLGGVPYNERTVGKVDLTLNQKYNSIVMALDPIDNNFGSIITDQLQVGDQVHLWGYSGQNYEILTKGQSGWPAKSFTQSNSFMVYLPGSTQERLCFVGQVRKNLPMARTLDKKYEAIGMPFPRSKSSGQLGLTPRIGDQIHSWSQLGQNYDITTYIQSGWGNDNNAGLAINEGKLYYIPDANATLNWDPRLE